MPSAGDNETHAHTDADDTPDTTQVTFTGERVAEDVVTTGLTTTTDTTGNDTQHGTTQTDTQNTSNPNSPTAKTRDAQSDTGDEASAQLSLHAVTADTDPNKQTIVPDSELGPPGSTEAPAADDDETPLTQQHTYDPETIPDDQSQFLAHDKFSPDDLADSEIVNTEGRHNQAVHDTEIVTTTPNAEPPLTTAGDAQSEPQQANTGMNARADSEHSAPKHTSEHKPATETSHVNQAKQWRNTGVYVLAYAALGLATAIIVATVM